MRDNSFSPSACTVKQGETRTFTNRGSNVHNATFSSGTTPLTTGNLSQDQTSQALSFDQIGELSYVCTNHFGMSGRIIVE
jgi:plastocyanin